MTSEAVACTINQAVLGEGLRWDASRGEILAVDILAGRVYRGRVADDGDLTLVRDYTVPGTVGAIAPVEGDEGWVLAAGRGLRPSVPGWFAAPLARGRPGGDADERRRLRSAGPALGGTLADDFRPEAGRFTASTRNGRVELMLDDLTISNGLGWSPDGATMYLADSGPRLVHAFNFDANSRANLRWPGADHGAEQVGTPDGLTVDADGDIWVAIYGGGRVQRYSPEGVLREELLVPAAQSTSCAFAGRASIGSTSPPRPRAGATISVAPSPLRGSCTASTPMPPAGRRAVPS